MSRLILVRHGQSAGNRDRHFAPEPHSLPLTDLGYRQAHAVAQRIARLYQPELVVSSPFVRAHETARVIAGDLVLPLVLEPQLVEREVGVHRGQPYGSLDSAPGYSLQQHFTWRPQAGESFEDVKARVGPVLERLAAQHPQRDVIIVSHGGVMLALTAYVRGHWSATSVAPNCGVIVIEHGPSGFAAPQPLEEEPLD